MGTMTDGRNQVITGVVPPETAEAMIRELWPSVASKPALAGLGKKITQLASKLAQTVVLLPLALVVAPVGWIIMAPAYFGKLLPFVARRYTLTNRRLMIRRGLKPKPSKEVALADIDDVRIEKDANSDFFMAGTLEVISKGQVVLTLPGVPGPEAFRHSILDACKAWVPGKANAPIIPASATKA
jgi:hypothetical protein